MDEDLVQNAVMNGKFVKNDVMNANIVPKVVVVLYRFKKLVDGTACSPATNSCWNKILMGMNLGC